MHLHSVMYNYLSTVIKGENLHYFYPFQIINWGGQSNLKSFPKINVAKTQQIAGSSNF